MTMVIMITRPPSGLLEVAVVFWQLEPRRAQSVMQRQRGYIEEPVVVSGQRALVCAIRTSQPTPWRTMTRLLSGSGSGTAVQWGQANSSIGNKCGMKNGPQFDAEGHFRLGWGQLAPPVIAAVYALRPDHQADDKPGRDCDEHDEPRQDRAHRADVYEERRQEKQDEGEQPPYTRET
jgi:hypothetical protein